MLPCEVRRVESVGHSLIKAALLAIGAVEVQTAQPLDLLNEPFADLGTGHRIQLSP